MNPPPVPNEWRWHAVHTKPRQEFRALEHLRNQHYECFLPVLGVERVRNRKKEACEEPLFSRYLFVRINPAVSNCSAIANTRGVSGIVTLGGRYATLADEWIDAFREASPRAYQALFAPGDNVTISAGPLAGFNGIYQAPSADERALVLIELMSRPQKLVLATELLRKAA